MHGHKPRIRKLLYQKEKIEGEKTEHFFPIFSLPHLCSRLHLQRRLETLPLRQSWETQNVCAVTVWYIVHTTMPRRQVMTAYRILCNAACSVSPQKFNWDFTLTDVNIWCALGMPLFLATNTAVGNCLQRQKTLPTHFTELAIRFNFLILQPLVISPSPFLLLLFQSSSYHVSDHLTRISMRQSNKK